MPRITDTIPLADKFLDRRTKLLPCQKEMIVWWYKEKGIAINAISRMFHVNKRSVQFILFPERKEKNIADRKARGGTAQYIVTKEERNQIMKDHRDYKKKVLTKDKIRRRIK